MKKIILIAALATMGCQANALDFKDLGEMVKKATKSSSSDKSDSASVDALSNSEVSGGLKEALTQGVDIAVSSLGAEDGFFGNKAVKIPLPESLKKIEKGMKFFGMGDQSDELILKMNRAAEAAAPEAKALLIGSIKQMSLADAKAILTGPDDAATQYFKKTTSTQMSEKFLPIVQKATENVQLASTYNKYAEMGSQFGVVDEDDANIQQYITNKALDGMYYMIAQEEAAIRKDPIGQASSLLKKVFGAIGKQVVKMKKDELIKALSDRNVPYQMYSLGEVGRGECYSVIEDNGSWKVAYLEREKQSDIKSGLTEEDAYDLVFKEFSSMYGWN